jgi:hypothetical protein
MTCVSGKNLGVRDRVAGSNICTYEGGRNSSVNSIMRMTWAGHVARMGNIRDAYTTLVEETEEKRALGSIVWCTDLSLSSDSVNSGRC